MIFCVDDDSAIRDIEVYTLQQTGFKAKGLSCADELFSELKKAIPDLIILDIMMAGKDGIQVTCWHKFYLAPTAVRKILLPIQYVKHALMTMIK